MKKPASNVLKDLIMHLKTHNLTLGSVESITGGLFASKITRISGVSKVFKGGIVSYTNDAKINVVGVKEEIINNYGAVSKETAIEMARRGQELFNADIVVSFTGNAGPTVVEAKPVGMVYICIRHKDKTNVFQLEFTGSRRQIQSKTVDFAIETLLEIIK